MEGVPERRAFVGRGAELARLRGLLAEAVGGSGRAVIVAGEAGIGKSRLLAQLGETAAGEGAAVLEGACLETADEGVPYAPFVEILRELVRHTPPERLPALLGPARGVMTRLVPELATRAADLAPPSGLDRDAQARLFELILGVIERLAGAGPVILAVEDVHWADRSTRELIAYLVRSLRDDAVLIVLALRTDEAGAAVGNLGFVAELEREEHVTRLDLGPFGRDEVEAQIAALVPGPPDAATIDRLLARSDGNPFYVEELVLAGGDAGGELPPVLRDVLVARISALSTGARAILRAAATVGRQIDDELLASVLGLQAGTLGDALREALASGILVRADPHGEPVVTFRHTLLQEVVSAELFPSERTALHAAVAAALEARIDGADAVASAEAPAAGEIARHWDLARRPDRALRPTIEAARSAERVYAFSEAHRLWARAAALALAVPDAAAMVASARDELLEHAADAAVLAGEYRSAIELGEAAITAADSGDGAADPARIGHLHDRLRWYLWEAGERQAAAEAVETALRLLPAGEPSPARARALGQHAGILLFAGEYDAAAKEATTAIEVARAVDAPGEEALALGVLGWSMAVLGDAEAGIERFGDARAIAERIGSVEGMALAAFNLTSLLDRIGQPEASLEAASDGYAMTERLGVARTYGGLLLGFRAKAEFLLGRWDDADASTILGLRGGAPDRAELWLSINRGRLLAARGSFDEARALLVRARLIDERLGETEFRSPLLTAEAELAVWEGRLPDVRRIADDGIRLAAKPGPPDPSLAWLAATALRAEADAASVRRGPPTPEAAAAVERLLRVIDTATASAAATRELLEGSTRGRALLELLRAERARLLGSVEPDRWVGVAAAWDAAGRPYPAAYARYRQAEATLADRGPRAAVAAALSAAASTARQLGAMPLMELVGVLARHARIPLDANGDALPTHAADDSDTAAALHLTERESEVLRLVAGGWTNQQIAEALFITRKTASVHVSNILGKLGVADRTAAAAMAHRLGLAGDAPSPPGADA